MKNKLSKLFQLLFITNIFRRISDLYFSKEHIRVINYHITPKTQLDNFEKQLQYYKKHYTPVTFQDFEKFYETGKWDKPKPGLIISFDDGQRSNYDYGVPLLEKHGFTGWFFVPTGFIDMPIEEQKVFLTENNFVKDQQYPDGRYAMSWDELLEMDKNHVIGSHTIMHHEVSITDDAEILRKEIIESKKRLEEKLQHEIPTFCWVRGRLSSYSQPAAKVIKEAGYKYSFMTNTYPILNNKSPLQIHRTNIETRDPMHLVKFQLCGFMDLYYYRKRNKVIDITFVPS